MRTDYTTTLRTIVRSDCYNHIPTIIAGVESGNIGYRADRVKRKTGRVCDGVGRRDLADYAQVLALAKYMGCPPYGKYGTYALKEILGDEYDPAHISAVLLDRVTGESLSDDFIEDLRRVHNGIAEGIPAQAFLMVERLFMSSDMLSKEEYEARGASLFEVELINDLIHLDENGNIVPGEKFSSFEQEMKQRRLAIDPIVVELVKNKFIAQGIQPGIGEEAIIVFLTRKD